MEWDYVFRVVLTDECALSPLREAIAKELLPALLGGLVTPSEVDLMLLPARFGGTGIRDPLDRVTAAYPASRASTKVVSKSVQGKAPFHPGDHRATIRHALTQSKQQQDVAHKIKREAALPHIDRRRHRVLFRSAEYKTSGWLTALLSTDNNTGLDAAEFRDALIMRYGRHPPGLAARCDHCNQPLTVDHALCCKRYGLVIRRHNELRDTFAELIGMAWGGRWCTSGGGVEGGRGGGGWGQGGHRRAASFNICITDADAPSYASKNRSTNPLREAIAKELLPALLGGLVTPSEVDLMLLPARFGGTGIRDPLDRVTAAYPASRASTKVVSKSVQGKAPFHPGDHRATIRHALTQSKQQQDVAHKIKREAALPHIDRRRHRVLFRSAEYKTSGWLTALLSTDNNTGLDAAEFRDALIMRYGRHPPGLAARCDHCNQPLTVDHALCCKRYGLVIRRHNELRDTFAELIGMAWGGRWCTSGGGVEGGRGGGGWGQGGHRRAASFNICITDADAPSYASKNRSTKSILKQHETAKKKKYRSAVCDSRVTFCPLVVTCDGVWGHDANVFIAHMAHALLEKEEWKGRGFSRVSG
ncbi:unnamed protein product [Vitrella brassicaformis CCMP3155]|uniref:Uncharacterized protein n=1 Tax=Vitrella brassicaformis (strain CCMP3155) TaxID=1169540 RepID=A0A0G4FG49_VITBC|nr:unnamed protein product [Vitrella brassicaformis CCMP3155]|eukprot:CEM12133.1 unnamed protein product [Vitrella brassicaformis CCMP3155]